jgi:hypothetical protein
MGIAASDRKLLLVGGCDLLQLSRFCSVRGIEFVNFMNIRSSRLNVLSPGENEIRYDDPSFFTADRQSLREAKAVTKLSGWTYEDATSLDQSIAQANFIILAMRAVLRHQYVVTKENIYIRIRDESLRFYLDNESEWFKRHFIVTELTTGDRLELIKSAFGVLNSKARDDAIIFVLGDNTRTAFNMPELTASVSYNTFCRNFCENNPGKFNFVEIRNVVQESSLIDLQPKTALNSNVRIFSASVRLAVLLRAPKS